MTSDDSGLRSVIIARFRRHSLGPVASSTGIFDELPESITAPLRSAVQLREGELFALGSIVSSSEWTVLTTCRLCFSCNGRVSCIENSDIKDISVDVAASAAAGKQNTYDLCDALIDSFSSNKIAIHVQPGGGYLGLISVLKMIADQNWRRLRPK